MQKQNIHLHNCSQTDLKRPQKCSHGTNLFIKVKVQFLCIDFANHRSCTSKKVQIDPKTSLAGRSTGLGPNNMRSNFLGSFWWQLSHVSLHLKSKIIGCPYSVHLEYNPSLSHLGLNPCEVQKKRTGNSREAKKKLLKWANWINSKSWHG